MGIIKKTEENSRHDHNSLNQSTRWEFKTSTTLALNFQTGELTFTAGKGNLRNVAEIEFNGYPSIRVYLRDDDTPILRTLFMYESPAEAKRIYPLVVEMLTNYRLNPVGDNKDAIVETLLLFLDTLNLRASGKVWQVSTDSGYVVAYYINKEMAESAIKYELEANPVNGQGIIEEKKYLLTLTDMTFKPPFLHGVSGW